MHKDTDTSNESVSHSVLRWGERGKAHDVRDNMRNTRLERKRQTTTHYYYYYYYYYYYCYSPPPYPPPAL